MRSLKEYKSVVDVLSLIPFCYYRMKMNNGEIALFEFIRYNLDREKIMSRETYFVESNNYFSHTSYLCYISEVMDNTLVSISVDEFNKISGREIM